MGPQWTVRYVFKMRQGYKTLAGNLLLNKIQLMGKHLY